MTWYLVWRGLCCVAYVFAVISACCAGVAMEQHRRIACYAWGATCVALAIAASLLLGIGWGPNTP